MMNEENVTSSRIVSALKAEALRRKSRGEEDSALVLASKATVSSSGRTRPPFNDSLFCSFCQIKGHELSACETAARILNEHQHSGRQSRGSSKRSDLDSSCRDSKNRAPSNRTRQSSQQPAKAGLTSVVVLGDDSSSDSDRPDSEYAGNALAIDSGHQALKASTDANINSGCSISMTPYADDLSHVKVTSTPVRLADNSIVAATHKGYSSLPLDISKSVKTLLVPELHEPLLSVAGMVDSSLRVVFTPDSCEIYDAKDFQVTGAVVGRGYRKGNLFYLPSAEVTSRSASLVPGTRTDNSLLGYHTRLSHIGLKPLKKLLKDRQIKPSILNEVKVQNCPICIQSKMHRSPFTSRSAYRSTFPGELIHSDVGSFEVPSREGYKYFVTFIDDYSKFLYVLPLKCKSEVFRCFKIFKVSFEKDGRHSIRALRSDNGGEYVSKAFESFLLDSGIHHQPGPPHSPELNGVAERANRTLGNLIRCLLLGSKLPKSFWVDALRHALFSFNSTPLTTPAGFHSPLSLLDKPSVDLKDLHPFGCLVWYKVPEANRRKLDPKARAALFLSYLTDGNGFRVWDLDRRQVVKTRDALFDDSVFPYDHRTVGPTPTITVELPWPPPYRNSVSSPPQTGTDVPPHPSVSNRPSILESPPLEVNLQPRFDRRLAASIHAPANQHRAISPVSIPTSDDSVSSDGKSAPSPVSLPSPFLRPSSPPSLLPSPPAAPLQLPVVSGRSSPPVRRSPPPAAVSSPSAQLPQVPESPPKTNQEAMAELSPTPLRPVEVPLPPSPPPVPSPPPIRRSARSRRAPD